MWLSTVHLPSYTLSCCQYSSIIPFCTSDAASVFINCKQTYNMQTQRPVLRTLKQSIPRTQSLTPRSALLLKPNLRDVWDDLASLRQLQLSYTNSKHGKVKQCCILLEGRELAKGQGDTWDRSRVHAIFQALQQLDPGVCEEWRRMFPAQAAKLTL